jgi:site-specific recombinase XerD
VLPIVGNQPPRQVIFKSLQLLLNKLAADGYGETSVGRIRTYIKACFEYATDEDLVSKNLARELEMRTIRKKVCEFFSAWKRSAFSSLRQHLASIWLFALLVDIQASVSNAAP